MIIYSHVILPATLTTAYADERSLERRHKDLKISNKAICVFNVLHIYHSIVIHTFVVN